MTATDYTSERDPTERERKRGVRESERKRERKRERESEGVRESKKEGDGVKECGKKECVSARVRQKDNV